MAEYNCNPEFLIETFTSQACPRFGTFGRSNLALVVCDQYNESLSQRP